MCQLPVYTLLHVGVIFLWCARLQADSSTSLHFVVEPSDTTVTKGANVTLFCSVADPTSVVFQWTLDGEILESDTRSFQNGSQLHITRVHPLYDLGQFRCFARNIITGHTITSRPAQLDIQWIGSDVKILSPSAWNPSLNDKMTLHCHSESNPGAHTEWLHNGKPLHPSTKVVMTSNQLMIKNLEMSDNGIYSCRASNEIGTSESNENFSLKLIDNLSPKIMKIPEDSIVPTGTTAYFECMYENAATVKWYSGRSDEPLENSTKFVLFPNGSLQISNVENQDKGLYRCLATGISPQSIPQEYVAYLKIAYIEDLVKNSLFMEHEDRYITLEVGFNFNMTCSPPEGFPPPRMWWEDPKGHVINDVGHIRVDDLKLIINDIQKADQGNYSCIAENTAGFLKKTVVLLIAEKLKFMPAPVNRKLELESNAKIYCKAAGSSPPVVKWVKENNSLSEWPPHIKDDNGTLHFTGVQSTDSGKYKCIARNSQGVINASIDVDVIVMPKFKVHPLNTEAMEGHNTIIHCLAVGDPPPTIQWDKNHILNGFDKNRFIVMENGSLYMSEVHLDDEGKYGCTAGNSGGFRRGEVTLTVKASNIANEAGFGGFGIDTESTMAKTIAITLGAAGVYMLLVVGLMIWCRYRRAQRKALLLAQVITEGNCETLENEVIQGIELKERKICGASTSTDGVNEEKVCLMSPKEDTDLFNNLQYSREKLQMVMLLGHGEYGQVFLAKASGIIDDSIETVVMVKSFEVEETHLSEFKKEIAMFNSLKHANVATLLGVCLKTDPIYMCLDYSDWGDLKQFLLATRSEEEKRKGPKPLPLTISQMLNVCNQVSDGMVYLSNKGFIHRDLAARNCLVSSKLKITISKPSLSQDTYSHEYFQLKNQILPLRWAPKEAILNNIWSISSDVWSFAVLVWEIFKKAEMPFSSITDEEVLKALQTNELVWEVPESELTALDDLLCNCWDEDKNKRPSFHTISSTLMKIRNDIK